MTYLKILILIIALGSFVSCQDDSTMPNTLAPSFFDTTFTITSLDTLSYRCEQGGGVPTEGAIYISKQAEHAVFSEYNGFQINDTLVSYCYRYVPEPNFQGQDYVEITFKYYSLTTSPPPILSVNNIVRMTINVTDPDSK